MNYIIPDKIEIENQLNNQTQIINTKNNIWSWYATGSKYKIVWNNLLLDKYLLIILKLFIIYRLKSRSLNTVARGDTEFLNELSSSGIMFPFNYIDIISFFNLSNITRTISTFRKFYEWALKNEFEGFEMDTYIKLKDYKIKSSKPYNKIFLQKTNIFSEQEIRLLIDYINRSEFKNIYDYRDNIILHLSYFLAPRPSQLYKLNNSDLIVTNSSIKSKKFYSINLSMSKKRSSKNIEQRQMSIDESLGNKIEDFIKIKNEIKNTDKLALFTSNKFKRLSSNELSLIISNKLKELGMDKSSNDIRHNLAQNLADQGASAEIIAELLGHNSTVPARAYIASTPKIGEIKSTALAKNSKYTSIMNMMITGEIIDKSTSENERSVKGEVNGQYIGGIGSCGLPSNTSCPKNPVYSCYTCIKFHPYKDGNHEEIKLNLQKQAQFFIDTAENGNDLKHNRPVTQLEQTILAVNKVIDKINDLK